MPTQQIAIRVIIADGDDRTRRAVESIDGDIAHLGPLQELAETQT
jgi:hypothetical protein